MTALSWLSQFFLNTLFLLILYLCQRLWFQQSRAWWRKRRWSLTLHLILFIGLMAGVAWVFHFHYAYLPPGLWWLYGLLAVYFIGSIPAAAVWGLWLGLRRILLRRPPATAADMGRRRFLNSAAGACALAPLACAGYGFLIERTDVRITHVSIPLERRFAHLRGLTMAIIADIHLSAYFDAHDLARVVTRINRLRPDLITILGDFISFRTTIPVVMQTLAPLRARYGKFGCLGNHEQIKQVQNRVTRACAGVGIEILRFSGREMAVPGGKLNLVGVDFFANNRCQDVRSIAGCVRPRDYNVLLSHNPNVFSHLGAMPIELTLAGHTHGGQIRLHEGPLDITPVQLVTPYIAGLYRNQGRYLYVNRGLGTVMVPIRFGARPEITHLQLG